MFQVLQSNRQSLVFYRENRHVSICLIMILLCNLSHLFNQAATIIIVIMSSNLLKKKVTILRLKSQDWSLNFNFSIYNSDVYVKMLILSHDFDFWSHNLDFLSYNLKFKCNNLDFLCHNSYFIWNTWATYYFNFKLKVWIMKLK